MPLLPQGSVPKGWKLEQKAEGDLNGDGKPDWCWSLRDDNPANIIKPEKNSDRTFQSNPRMIAVVVGRHRPRLLGVTRIMA